MKFSIKNLLKRVVAAILILAITTAASARVHANTPDVFFSTDVPLESHIMRVEILTPHEMLGVITVDWVQNPQTQGSRPFSVVLIDNDEPYLLVRYYASNHPDGVFMPLWLSSLRGLVTGGSLGRLVTASSPAYIRFGVLEWEWEGEWEDHPPMWYGINRISGRMLDAEVVNSLMGEFLDFDAEIDPDNPSWMSHPRLPGIDWDAYFDARDAALATGSQLWSNYINYIVMTPSQLDYFYSIGALPSPETAAAVRALAMDPLTIALRSTLT